MATDAAVGAINYSVSIAGAKLTELSLSDAAVNFVLSFRLAMIKAKIEAGGGGGGNPFRVRGVRLWAIAASHCDLTTPPLTDGGMALQQGLPFPALTVWLARL